MPNPKGNPHTLKSFKSTWKSGKTKTIRVPVAIATEVLDAARLLDNDNETLKQVIKCLKEGKDIKQLFQGNNTETSDISLNEDNSSLDIIETSDIQDIDNQSKQLDTETSDIQPDSKAFIVSAKSLLNTETSDINLNTENLKQSLINDRDVKNIDNSLVETLETSDINEDILENNSNNNENISTDNKVIILDNQSDRELNTNIDNNSNEPQILDSNKVKKLADISSTTLHKIKSSKKPREWKGYSIEFSHREGKLDYWRVTEIK